MGVKKNPVGRPKKDPEDKLDYQIKFYAGKLYSAKLQYLAEALGKSKSEVLRQLIKEAQLPNVQ